MRGWRQEGLAYLRRRQGDFYRCFFGDVAGDLDPVLQLAVHLHDHRYPLLGEQAYVRHRPRPRVNVVSVAVLVGLSGEVGGERCQQLQQGVDRLVDDGPVRP